ncbi:mannose-6-phosphate isomerase-like protein (cupin superfamily) [Caldicoprobacter guelmensis]|uniref:dimethylsulfonioproprionate lyase family protein n=1 Tax=Caldicoprobacter guelmensis TaxID=1170224 RepID=UPI00195A9862|nr:dimethylsulfonioproprionate lyase family protein [Caldicoprobacter guelmensis]MBM7583230.1 mannose-6-phosphate isomerase-like protein (cupin superfamily) [Caldicoprobacter guelmensis]
MKYVVNVQSKQPDIDPRSLRARVKDRDKAVLRDTYFLIDPEESPSRRLKMGYTIIYPTGTTTGHSHNEEEVYYVISGEGVMVVGEDEFPIKAGDALYVPPREFHTTYQKGNMPLVVLWVTGKLDPEECEK